MLDLQRLLRDAVADLDREQETERRLERSREERAARVFLDKLDSESQEGMWFEALAERFPTRIEAAIAYLRDVKR